MRHSALLILNIALCNVTFGLDVFKDFCISNRFTREIPGYAYPFKNRNAISTVSWSKIYGINIIRTWNELGMPINKQKKCVKPVFLGNDIEVSRITSVQEVGKQKIIILTDMRSTNPEIPYLANMYIIYNPVDCTGTNLELAGENGQLIYHSVPVTYRNDMFEIFPIFYNGSTPEYMSTLGRYKTTRSKPINVPDSIDPELKLSGDHDLIYAVNSKSPSEGYFIVTNDKKAATFYLLSSKLKLEKKVYKEGIYVYAASTGFCWITVCYNKKKQLTCDVLDKDLNLKFEVSMMSQPNGTLLNVWVDNLFDGTVMILSNYNFTVKNDAGNERIQVSYAQRIFQDGSTSEPLKLGAAIDGSAESRSRGLLMDNGEYCAVNVVAKQVDQDWSSNVTAICADPLIKPESIDEEEDSEEDSEEDEDYLFTK